jgi:putative mRNA 3-end processing factor
LVEVVVRYKKSSVRLDSTRVNAFNGYEFISHAHTDHLTKARERKRVICTEETSLLAAVRGVEIKAVPPPEGFDVLSTGHMLGSAGLSIDGLFFYTGDIKLETYFFETPAIPRVECLLMESTYGSPEFLFPKPFEVLSQALDDVKYFLRREMPCVLMGYSLGKAQHLQIYFDERIECDKYTTQEIDVYNDIYRLFGYGITKKRLITGTPAHTLNKRPWILYYPLRGSDDIFLKYLKKRYGAVLIAFTGWATKSEFAFGAGFDLTYPLSDHADFEELCEIVKRADPEKVLVLKGNARGLINELKRQGYSVRKVIDGNTVIDF